MAFQNTLSMAVVEGDEFLQNLIRKQELQSKKANIFLENEYGVTRYRDNVSFLDPEISHDVWIKNFDVDFWVIDQIGNMFFVFEKLEEHYGQISKNLLQQTIRGMFKYTDEHILSDIYSLITYYLTSESYEYNFEEDVFKNIPNVWDFEDYSPEEHQK
jgi:hypothetical protein